MTENTHIVWIGATLSWPGLIVATGLTSFRDVFDVSRLTLSRGATSFRAASR